MTQQIATGGGSAAIAVSWDYLNRRISWLITGYSGGTFLISAYNKAVDGTATTALTYNQYLVNASLPKTLGMSPTVLFYNANNSPAIPGFPVGSVGFTILGNATNLLYTNYVDIVSVRLNQYRTIQDGASKNLSRRPMITRLYCANETSTQEFDISGMPIPIGSQAFLINRQL